VPCPLKNNLRDRASQRLIGLLLVLGPSLAFAELPTMEAPSRGEGSGLIETIKTTPTTAASCSVC